MIFSFMFFYLMGAFVFCCHTSIITSKSAGILSSKMPLTEDEVDRLFTKYFSKILFQTVIMTIFPLSFGFYVATNHYFSATLVVSSGFFTVIWLMITGILIKLIYYFVTHHIKSIRVFDFDKYGQNNELLWTMCPILYGILFSLYDYTIFFTIFAIVLGKYIWMDTFRTILLSDIKIKVKNFLKNSKPDILLLLCQTLVMGYFLIRWYPIKNESIHFLNIGYTMTTFLLAILFLMPIIDFLIFISMKSYSGFIKQQN